MSDSIVVCSNCGVKLKLKADRPLPEDAACPKCSSLLFSKKKPVAGPSSTGTSSSGAAKPAVKSPAAAPPRTSKPTPPAVRRPAKKEEIDEFDDVDEFEDELEDDDDYVPRKRSKSKKRSSGGIPGWMIGAGIGVMAVGLVVGVFLLLPGGDDGAQPVAGQPVAPAAANGQAAAPGVPAGGPTSSMPTPTAAATGAPAAAVIPTIPAAANGAIVKYSPKADSRFYYDLIIESEFEQYTEESKGSVTLTAQKAVRSGFSIRPESQEGSGTGFVVGSNGVIVTCAHVVDGAETTEVTIGGVNYPATVLHSDTALDLAVIKIEANGLQVVPLADSNQIQLGQDVRVIGFPLSTVLGTGIKVTQGSVSGIVDQDGHRMIQTDATINPGNSGGPVFNTRGEVVGIASAKLAGGAISQVGFCVPSSTLSAMLQSQGIILSPPAPGQEMNTPALVQKVTPSVAFIKVKVGDNSQAQVGLNYSATISTYKKGKTNVLIGLDRAPPTFESGKVSLTEFGKPVDVDEGSFAPIVMTRLPLLPFVELSKSGQTDWTNQREISIVRQENNRSRSPFGFRGGHYDDLFGAQRPKVVAIQKAMERDTFHVTTSNAQQLVLARTYELKTTDGSEPGIVLNGTGTWTLDRADGMPLASDLNGTYKISVSGLTITIPFTLAISRWSKERIDELEKTVAENAKMTPAERLEKQKAETERLLNGVVESQTPGSSSDVTRVIFSSSSYYKSLSVSPNGKHFAVANSDDAIQVYNFETGKEVDTKIGLDKLGTPSRSSYSPDGKYLVLGGYDGPIRVWAVAEDGDLDALGDFVGHASEIQAIGIMPDNKTVVSADRTNVRGWNIDDQTEKFSFTPGTNFVAEIGIAPDGKSAALFQNNSMVSSINLLTGKPIEGNQVFKFHYGQKAEFTSDGSMLFVPDSRKLVCQPAKGKKPAGVIDLGESIESLDSCLQTGEVFVGGRGNVHVVDWKKETRTKILGTGGNDTIRELNVTPDGRFLVAIGGTVGRTLMIFDREAKKGPTTDEKPDAKDDKADAAP